MTALLFRDNAYLQECNAIVTGLDERGIHLDRTIFYAASGGQAGDQGTLRTPEGIAVSIVDTRRSPDGEQIVHVPAPGSVPLSVGSEVHAVLDWERRHRLMRLHTSMHLLCAVVPAPVTGGSIVPDKAHLDFDIEMEKLRKEEIEERVNALIAGGHDVTARWITDEELAAQPDLVRTMSVQPPTGTGRVRLLDIAGVDLQPCGGTHVRNTREIGPVVVQKIRSEGRRNKRVILAFAG